jgi:type III secretory pathway component EscV
MALHFKRPLFLVALFLLLLVFVIMGFPTWVSLFLGLLVLLYVGYVFSSKDVKEISAKENKVVCSNCHYDNKTGALVCKQCKVKLK